MAGRVELDKVYDPKAVEGQMLALWQERDCFAAVPDERPRERRFVIVIPPPNVTGALHLGHALNNTLQDVLIRWHRMRGDNTLWQPGTDHAGIATQAMVEKTIRHTEGKSRHDLGRDELVGRIWQWKDQYEARILSQLKLMGCSCDWSRNRFTLDDGCSRAVREFFFRLFKDGLIFRGKRLVNWDTQLQTAVSDDELYHETIKGHFWHFKYPVVAEQDGHGWHGQAPGWHGQAKRGHDETQHARASGSGMPPGDEPQYVIIATTRPETMLGDVAVAVHPDPAGELDRREAKLRAELAAAGSKERAAIESDLARIAERRTTHLPVLIQLRDMARAGRQVMLPLVNRPIPIVCDEWADPLLGSGCVKITPAHDPNDFAVGERSGLPRINVLAPDGTVAPIIEADGTRNANSSRYEGLTFNSEARQRVVADIEAAGLLDQVEDREIEIGHSERSKTPIEPFLSDQWFVRMGQLAPAAMQAVEDGRVKFHPARYAKTYLDWLGEKRDWCISRQLWWGHRIPVWHKRFDRPTFAETGRPGWSEADNVRLGDVGAVVVTPLGEWRPVPWDDETLFHMPYDDAADKPIEVFVCLPTDDGDSDELKVELEAAGFWQDPDVLDTWFSSALWPFSTLGWPEDTPDLRYYYPGSVLSTARGIITNWVARMVLAGHYLLDEKPFDDVYIHPTILDARGETMSKSKGNGVDPIDLIDVYGADALRYTLADLATETQEIRMPVEYLCPHCGGLTAQTSVVPKGKQPIDVKKATCKACKKPFATVWADDALKAELGMARDTSDKFEIGRNFCNKLWNAARFAFGNLENTPYERLDLASLPTEDRWILARLSQAIADYHGCLSRFHFSSAVKVARDFFWDGLCDWYIELTKRRVQGAGFRVQDSEALGNESEIGNRKSEINPQFATRNPQSAAAKQILAFCLDQVLRMLHPIVPFITERLWRELNALVPQRGLPGVAEPAASDLLILAEFPPAEGWPKLDDPRILSVFEDLQAATRGIRDLRSRCTVAPRERVTVTIKPPADRVDALRQQTHVLEHLAGVGRLTIDPAATRPPNAGSLHAGGLHIIVHDISDDDRERKRLTTELAETEKQIAAKQSKLANEKFVANADPQVVQDERDRLTDLETRLTSLRESLAELT